MNGNSAPQDNNDVELKEVVSTSNGQTSVSESSALLENSSDEYIKYQKALERCLIFKKISSLCSRTPDINLSNIFVKEEKINLSTDKSACVSLILRHIEDETFWEKAANKDILIKFEDSTDFKVENLFSILMYDWHEPDKNPHQSYFLIKKFEELTNGRLFEKLWKIFEDQKKKQYHQTCLKILYYYIEEKRKYFYNFTDKDKDAANSFSKFLLQRIDEVLATIKSNVNFKIQILKILIVFLQPSELNDDLKLKILQIFGNEDLNEKINEVDITICKGSYAEMINNCDEIFFKLVFIMKKNFAMNFKIEYKKYVEINKNYFGEYWSHQIVQNAKLLLLMADIQDLTDTKEFILINTSESDLISDILTTYRNTAEFLAVLNEPLDNADRKRMKEFEDFIQKYKNFQPDNEEAKFIKEQVEKLFRNTPDTRRLILGRTTLESNSIFEQILENGMYRDCIKYIWNEFELWNKPEILCLKNHTGKYLMDYVLNAKNGMQLISFLMSTETRECEKIRKPIHYMMLKNAIFYDVSGIEYDIINAVNPPQQTKVQVKCLFEYQMFLIDQGGIKDYENLQNILYLLEEIFQYCPDKKGKNEFFVAFLKQIFDEKPEEFDGTCELKMPRKHFYIGLMMIYWKYYLEFRTTGKAFSIKLHGQNIADVTTLNESTTKIPFFEILSLIIQYKEKEVVEGLADFYKNMEELYINTYNIPSYCAIEDDQEEIFHLYEKYSTNFSFIFLYAAIKTNQKNILDAIFDYNHFLISCPSFPQNMKAEEIHNDTVAKFIENRYELGREDFPKHWVSHKMLKNFLDSRITCEDNYYKVDCRFMLPYYNYDKIDKPTSDDMIVNEDYQTMKYILHDYNLKSLVSHPVMEMVIRSKISKYSRLFFWNLVLFLTFYVIPTIFLVVELHSTRDVSNSTETIEDVLADPDYYSEENSTKIAEDQPELPDMKLVKLDYTWIIILTLMRVPILLFRELFQLVFRQNCLDYFKRKSNWIEMLLILLPVALFVATCCNYIYPSTEAFIAIAVIEVINIILMITATVSLYPILKFSIYIKCFFKVFVTYLRVFGLLLPLFFGCVAIVFILFDKKIGGGIEDFYSFTNACVKYIIMYSGELSIDADQINGILQVTAMLVIIFLIINKGNLILSIVIDDVQKIMNQAKEISLRLYAEKYVEFAEQIRTFYACNIEDNQEYKETNYKNITDKIFSKIKKFLTTKYGFLYWFIKFLTREYSHLHRINILYVEKKSGNVFIVRRRPLFESWNWIVKWCNKWSVFRKLTSFWDKLFSHLTLEEDTMKKIAKLMGTEGGDDED